MKRRLFIQSLALCVAIGFPAFARSFSDEVISQLVSQGYSNIVTETTWLGRVRILADISGGRREIILNPRTGEILRDLWTAADGSAGPIAIVKGQGGSGTGSTSGSSSGGDTGGGSSGGDNGGTSGGDNGGTSGGDDGGTSGGDGSGTSGDDGGGSSGGDDGGTSGGDDGGTSGGDSSGSDDGGSSGSDGGGGDLRDHLGDTRDDSGGRDGSKGN